MNLITTVKILINEELTDQLRRRIDFEEFEKSFENSLDIQSTRFIKFKDVWNMFDVNKFKHQVLSQMIDEIFDKVATRYGEGSDLHKLYYDLWDFLDNFYSRRISKAYYDIEKQINESILNEETSQLIWLRRRLVALDNILKYKIKDVYTPKKICILYKDADELLEVIIEAVAETMYYSYFSNMDDLSYDWQKIYYHIHSYIKEEYSEKIKEYYHINCGD